jgi:hypothetical protein
MRRDLQRRLDALERAMAPAWEAELDRRDLPLIEAEMAKPAPLRPWPTPLDPTLYEVSRRNSLVNDFRLRRKETPQQTEARHRAEEQRQKDIALKLEQFKKELRDGRLSSD